MIKSFVEKVDPEVYENIFNLINEYGFTNILRGIINIVEDNNIHYSHNGKTRYLEFDCLLATLCTAECSYDHEYVDTLKWED